MTDIKEIDCPCGGKLIRNYDNDYFKCARCGGEISVIKLNDLWLKEFVKDEIKRVLSKVILLI